MNKINKQIENTVSKYSSVIKKISLNIHANPELEFKEFKACKWQADFFEKNGFAVKRNFKGIETSYNAVFGSGKPVVCIMAEYDALPKLGHACGHNLSAGCALAAGIALKNLIEKNNLKGTVDIMGTPAEEGAGGKVKLIEKGALKNIDIALTAHSSGRKTAPDPGSSAVDRFEVSFKGIAAHAAGCPEKGINALDAVRLVFNAVDAWRQQLPETCRVHGIVTNGGAAANIIPEFASCVFYLRSFDYNYLEEMTKRFHNIVKGAALMTNTKEFIKQIGYSYKNRIPNSVLNKTYFEEAESLKMKPEYVPSTRASSDFGNVTHLVPGIHPYFRIAKGKKVIVSHSSDLEKHSGTDYALEQMLLAGQIFARIGYKYLTDKEYQKQVRADFVKQK